jgi:hypothetical protein
MWNGNLGILTAKLAKKPKNKIFWIELSILIPSKV